MEGIVEQVRDGSTLRVYLLPGFQFVQVFMAGIQASFALRFCYFYYFLVHANHMYLFYLNQAPQMGRRAAPETVVEPELAADETNGGVPGEPQAPLTSAQRLAVSSSAETVADPFALDAKVFTEMRVLNRDVGGLLL